MSTGRLSIFALVVSLLLSLGLAPTAWTQEVTAAIVGTVTDPSRAPVKDADVSATDTDRGTVWAAKTNDAGAYTLPRLPVGSYTVKVSASGFSTSQIPAFTLVLNQTARVDVQMKVGQVSETVEVTGAAPDAIQEFNLITSNASAEFSNFQGGIVSTTIKSGTNSFHGDLWEYFRNDKLNSNQWENGFIGINSPTGQPIPRPLLRWNMFGGTIGGPVVKNKLFFFFDYQGQRF